MNGNVLIFNVYPIPFFPQAASERSLPAYNPIITFRTPTDWQVSRRISLSGILCLVKVLVMVNL